MRSPKGLLHVRGILQANMLKQEVAAIQRFCSEMEETPVHVILGLFHTISKPLPPFMQWETGRHHRALNSNSEACSTMTAIRGQLDKHGMYKSKRYYSLKPVSWK